MASTFKGRFLYLGFLIATVGAVAVSAGIYKVAVQDTKTVTVTKDAPPLTSSATVAQVRARFAEQPNTISGNEAGQAVAQSCPQVDIYQAADGAVLVCHS